MQTNLDMFIKKKKQNNPSKVQPQEQKKYHASSRENSETQPLQPINERIRQIQPVQQGIKGSMCKLFVLPGPSDSTFYPIIEKKLKNLKNSYNPMNRNVLYDFLEANLKYHNGINNVQILKEIEDPIFWKVTLPKMISLFLQKHQNISCSVRTLIMTGNCQSMITRQQALLLLISLFFGIMPKNPLSRARSFGEYMTRKQGQRNQNLKKQKLKFIVNYFNIAMQKISEKDTIFSYETISFQKIVSNVYEVRKDFDTQNYHGKDWPLIDVDFSQSDNSKIQDFYGKAAMVDFANENIGGGVLTHGCVQQEILFLIYPQALVSMLISPQMSENESIVIYGLRRFSNYKNYSYSVQFDGPYESDDLNQCNTSVMIAIDAINFHSKISSEVQFSKQNTFRQIVKAITGFRAIGQSGIASITDMKICTGRWGCGAFKGDQVWKFFIQWISCSYSERGMIYLSDQLEILQQIKEAVKRLVSKSKTVLDLFAIMQYFMEVKQRSNKPNTSMTFLDFLKSQALM